ncbi:cell wall-binding repeat-containing protein [Clostridium lundense]|uniref:cell wall-binding repeat-containing protein n=1 Tax=Clostridium lundense TaxID=319475 RepID=UPI00068415B4|nr:cell wall-binding repeat-containing protein [Clostridium lundense]
MVNYKKYNKRIRSTVVATALLVNIIAPINVQALGNFDIKSSFISKEINERRLNIAPNITQKLYTFRDKDNKKQEMFVVEVYTKNNNASIEAGTPNNKDAFGMQKVSLQAKAEQTDIEHVIAAVNGDFYYMVTGEPIGVIHKDGRAVRSKHDPKWNFFAIKRDGTPIIGDSKTYDEVKGDLEEALGGNAILVKDGSVYQTPPVGSYREPRTAVGIKEDGTVFFVAIDGKQEPYSAGISVKDLANLMIDMGAVQALNLDGGGSTTFVGKKPGTDNLTVWNRPSDGVERNVANSWLAVTRVEPTNVFAQAHIQPFDRTYTPESTINFQAIGMDESGSPAALPSEGLEWSIADKSFGDMYNSGMFISNGKLGQTEVLLCYNKKVVGRTWIEIAKPDEVYSNVKNIKVNKNSNANINIYCKYRERDVILKNNDILWEVPEEVGTIDEHGVLHTKDRDVAGKITAKIKGTNISTTIDVLVGDPSQINKIKIANKTRIAGASRFNTATSIAKKLYGDKVSNVVIANAYNFADQISASVLGDKLKAPVLLIGNNPQQDKEALTYIKQSMEKGGKVFLVGGKNSIGDALVGSIKSLGNNNIERIEGKDIYETHIKINDRLNVEKGTPIIIASGEGFADALSAATIAQINKYPIVLTEKNNLSKAAETYIKNISPSKVYIIGGEGVVSGNVKDAVSNITKLSDSDIVRISGADRYKTNMSVLNYFNIEGDTVAIASGVSFPDSLVGSVYAGNNNAPILLVNNTMDLSEQSRYVYSKGYKNCIIFGGEGVVSSKLF